MNRRSFMKSTAIAAAAPIMFRGVPIHSAPPRREDPVFMANPKIRYVFPGDIVQVTADNGMVTEFHALGGICDKCGELIKPTKPVP